MLMQCIAADVQIYASELFSFSLKVPQIRQRTKCGSVKDQTAKKTTGTGTQQAHKEA